MEPKAAGSLKNPPTILNHTRLCAFETPVLDYRCEMCYTLVPMLADTDDNGTNIACSMRKSRVEPLGGPLVESP